MRTERVKDIRLEGVFNIPPGDRPMTLFAMHEDGSDVDPAVLMVRLQDGWKLDFRPIPRMNTASCGRCQRPHDSLRVYMLHPPELVKGVMADRFYICPDEGIAVYVGDQVPDEG